MKCKCNTNFYTFRNSKIFFCYFSSFLVIMLLQCDKLILKFGTITHIIVIVLLLANLIMYHKIRRTKKLTLHRPIQE